MCGPKARDRHCQDLTLWSIAFLHSGIELRCVFLKKLLFHHEHNQQTPFTMPLTSVWSRFWSKIRLRFWVAGLAPTSNFLGVPAGSHWHLAVSMATKLTSTSLKAMSSKSATCMNTQMLGCMYNLHSSCQGGSHNFYAFANKYPNRPGVYWALAKETLKHFPSQCSCTYPFLGSESMCLPLVTSRPMGCQLPQNDSEMNEKDSNTCSVHHSVLNILN